MPADDFYKCMIYEQLEPFGGRRIDVLAGMICQVIFNMLRGEKQQALSTADMMPKWNIYPVEPKIQTVEEQLDLFIKMQQAIKGTAAS